MQAALKEYGGRKQKFQRFLKKALLDPEMALNGTTLESLMIQPVQRVPRYRMLVEELLKARVELSGLLLGMVRFRSSVGGGDGRG